MCPSQFNFSAFYLVCWSACIDAFRSLVVQCSIANLVFLLCRQLNDELTAKTESLVQEADEVLVSIPSCIHTSSKHKA